MKSADSDCWNIYFFTLALGVVHEGVIYKSHDGRSTSRRQLVLRVKLA